MIFFKIEERFKYINLIINKNKNISFDIKLININLLLINTLINHRNNPSAIDDNFGSNPTTKTHIISNLRWLCVSCIQLREQQLTLPITPTNNDWIWSFVTTLYDSHFEDWSFANSKGLNGISRMKVDHHNFTLFISNQYRISYQCQRP